MNITKSMRNMIRVSSEYDFIISTPFIIMPISEADMLDIRISEIQAEQDAICEQIKRKENSTWLQVHMRSITEKIKSLGLIDPIWYISMELLDIIDELHINHIKFTQDIENPDNILNLSNLKKELVEIIYKIKIAERISEQDIRDYVFEYCM